MSFRSDRKIVTMPMAAAHTPEVVIARTMEKVRAGGVKGVVIGIMWDDDTVGCDYSSMPVMRSQFVARAIQHELDQITFDVMNEVEGDN